VTKVILVPGNGGCAPDDFWYPRVADECSALGLSVINQPFPDPVRARARFWLPFLEELGADAQTILIGHSSGAVAAMRFAETHRLLGSILVSVCHTDLGDSGEAASGYYSAPWQWERIRANQQWTAIYHSTDDPHIPAREARFVAAQLKGNYFEFADRGHFLDPGALPEAVPYLARQLGW
jgi:predicted alpha/beta hydrolase family esterase